MRTSLPELYIATDVEADGPIPGPYSMISLGMSVVGMDEKAFYTEIQPISDQFQADALSISGLDRQRLLKEAPRPKAAMMAAFNWINSLKAIGRPVFLAGPAVWDGMFVHWYFMNFVGQNPFGPSGSGIDLRSYWMGYHGCEWAETKADKIKTQLKLKLAHTHHAGEDAQELANIFEHILKHRTLPA